jgi:hypothetical protein
MVALGATIAGCSNSAVSPYPQTKVNPLNGVLELAVGTANVYGDVTGSTNIGLNVVETFRQNTGGQTPGDTDALVTSPTLSGPFTLPATPGTADGLGATLETGPGPTDAGTHTMNNTAQPNPGQQTLTTTTFGVSTNASGLGLEPYNYTSVNGNNAGTPLSYVPYTQPLFDPNSPSIGTGADLNAFVPWGGPPAFDPDGTGLGVRDGQINPPGVEGVSLGLDVFEHVAPVGGAYTFSVLVPTGVSTTGTETATSTLPTTPAILPAIKPATVVPDANNDGGASVTLTLPAGVTQAYVNIVDVGPDAASLTASGATANCNNALGDPVYYTLEFTASGTQSLPTAAGPGTGLGLGSPSICTTTLNTAANSTANGGTGMPSDGDEFFVQTLGFDYPAFAISYPNSKGNPSPIPAGTEADITISSSANCLQATTFTCTSAATPDEIKRKFAKSREKMLSRDHIIR